MQKARLIVGLNEIRYPKNTASNTCTIDDKLERSLVQGLNERVISERDPSSFFIALASQRLAMLFNVVVRGMGFSAG